MYRPLSNLGICFLLVCTVVAPHSVFAMQRAANAELQQRTRQQIEQDISQVSALMAADDYESAYEKVNHALRFADTTTYSLGKYYLYAFQAEILYYHAIYNSALGAAYKAKVLSNELANDTLIGSIDNLIGLLLSNMNRKEEAEEYLRWAVEKLPANHGNENLSYRFHATSNLAEIFIEMNLPDSALYYADWSMREAKSLNKNRAKAINHWNFAKAYLQKKNFPAALQHIEEGKAISTEKTIQDVSIFFASLEAEAMLLTQQEDACQKLLSAQLESIENRKDLTVFSKIDFLKEAADLLFRIRKYELALKAQTLLSKLRTATEEKNIALQMQMIADYYENEKRLQIAEAENSEHEAQLKLKNTILYGGVAVFIMCIAIAGLSINGYVQKQKLNSLRLESEKEALSIQKEKEKVEERIIASNHERNRIAKELHDDLGSSLSSISLYADVALKDINRNPQKTEQLLQTLTTKSKELAENMSDIIWAIYSKNDTFENLLMRMKNFSFEMVTPLNIQIDFQYPYEVTDISLNAEQRKNIYYIFKESVNNAVKHSQCTAIQVNVVQLANRQIQLSITDNGKGFNIDGVNKNNGIYTIQSRAKAINGLLTINSAHGQGTVVAVLFSAKS